MDFVKVMMLIWLALAGAILGSFACCQAWRLHERGKKKKLNKRSICMKCKMQLKWYDNIPVISWLMLRGKCRKCGAKIGAAEILSELGMAATFLLLGLRFWDGIVTSEGWMQAGLIAQLVILLIMVTAMWVLVVYDAKWSELPVGVMVFCNVLAVGYVILMAAMRDWQIDMLSLAGSVTILAGVYYLLYFLSKEKLVGGGDWILCLAIALVLMDWRMAIFELFLSNCLALFVSAPLAIIKKQKQVPFGPFLVVAFVILLVAAPLLKQFCGNYSASL